MGDVSQLTVKFDQFSLQLNEDISKLNRNITGVRETLYQEITEVSSTLSRRLDSVEGKYNEFMSDHPESDYRALRSDKPSAALSPAEPSTSSASEDSATQYSYVKDLVSKTSIVKDLEVPFAKKNIGTQTLH